MGAPEADTALAVLPGHVLLMEGRGAEAIRLSAIGSAGAVIVSLIMAIPMAYFFLKIYGILNDYIGWILVLIVVIMIATENGEYVEGQGSLAHLKFKFYALLLFFISGFLGVFAFDNTILMQPLVKFGEPSILLPLLSGLFGASMLVISLMTKSELPPQQKNCMFVLPRKRIIRGMVTGTAAGSFVAWLPGVSSAVGTLLARLFVREEKDSMSSKEFMVSISSANTANAIFSLIALFIIGKARSGAMVAIDQLVNVSEWDYSIIILLLIVIIYVSAISYFTTIYLGDRISGFLSRINYSKLCAERVGRTINYDLYVHRLVRFYHFLDIHACWNDSILCKNKKNKCHGGHNAACDIVFPVKKRNISFKVQRVFSKIFDSIPDLLKFISGTFLHPSFKSFASISSLLETSTLHAIISTNAEPTTTPFAPALMISTACLLFEIPKPTTLGKLVLTF